MRSHRRPLLDIGIHRRRRGEAFGLTVRFARHFLMSDRYQRTLERRILAGTAPHMEVLLHHYAFGKPTHKYVAPAPAAPTEAELLSRMTIEEQREIYELWTKRREIYQAAAARSATPPASQ